MHCNNAVAVLGNFCASSYIDDNFTPEGEWPWEMSQMNSGQELHQSWGPFGFYVLMIV